MKTARRAPLLVLLALTGCLGLPETPARDAAEDSRRSLALGEVVGSVGRHGAHEWRGLPFAAAPSGARRWRAPEPPEPWTGVREALADPNPCPQFTPPGGGSGGAEVDTPMGDEDCLALNVFAPRLPPDAVPSGDARMPVLFWIHGGGNSIGDASIYDGGALAQRYGVVVVSTQYRLGPFGWFRHPALRNDPATTPEDASGNYGTLDLIRGLDWVQEHIAAFGGDPGNVTIFGESAGGRDVVSLLLSPLAKARFHRAIVQSGSARTASLEQAENWSDDAEPGHSQSSAEITARLLVEAGDAADRDAAKAKLAELPPAEIAAFLRRQSAADILNAYQEPRRLGMIGMPQVFPDGVVQPSGSPYDAFAQGRYNQVPTILGTNRDEVRLFMLGNDELVSFGLLLPRFVDRVRFEREADASSGLWKARAVDELAARMRPVQGPSVWAYRFDWDEEPSFLWSDFSALLGAAHGLEIPFVFADLELFGSLGRVLFDDDNEAASAALAGTMSSYWVEFARSGAPGKGRHGTAPEWTPWQNEEGALRLMVLDTPRDGGVRMVPDRLSKTDALAKIASDDRFESAAERCGFLATQTSPSSFLTPQDLAEIGCEI